MTTRPALVPTAFIASACLVLLGGCAASREPTPGGDAAVTSAATAIDGETAVVLGDLKAGDRINVWTGACRESMPVQCDVEAVTSAA